MWSFMFANARVNRIDVDRLDRKANQIKSEILDQESGSDAIRIDVGRMMLAMEALKNLLVAKGVITEQEFEDAVIHLDLEDGVRDGLKTQRRVPRQKCSQCGRLNRKRSYCYACGQPLNVEERVSRQKKSCPRCEQINTPRAVKCLYCGTKLGAQGQGQPRKIVRKR